METMAPGIIVSAVGVATVASTGALIANYGYEISARLQVPIVIFAYIMLRQGLMVYAALIQKFMTAGFPAGPKLTTLILLVRSSWPNSPSEVRC